MTQEVPQLLCPLYRFSAKETALPDTFEKATQARLLFRDAPSPPSSLDRFKSIPRLNPKVDFAALGPAPGLQQAPLYYWWNQPESQITYVNMYRNDNGIGGRGGHAGDVEFVRIHYDASTMQPTKAYYAAHGRDQGMWVPANELQTKKMGSRTALLVFPAISTHASYPSPGLWVRLFGLGNDRSSADVPWDPVANLLPLDPAAVKSALGNGHMQWHAPSAELIGVPKGRMAASLFRFAYPLSRIFRA